MKSSSSHWSIFLQKKIHYQRTLGRKHLRLQYEVCIVYLEPFKCVCHSGYLNAALLKAMSLISKK